MRKKCVPFWGTYMHKIPAYAQAYAIQGFLLSVISSLHLQIYLEQFPKKILFFKTLILGFDRNNEPMATEDDNDALLSTRVQFLDDTDIFSSSNFPEPTRPPTYTIPRYRNGQKSQKIFNEPKLACFVHNLQPS